MYADQTKKQIDFLKEFWGKHLGLVGISFQILKPRANGRNIVGQQLPTLLDVTCCVRLHTLLHVVAQSLKPVKLSANNSQHFFCSVIAEA